MADFSFSINGDVFCLRNPFHLFQPVFQRIFRLGGKEVDRQITKTVFWLQPFLSSRQRIASQFRNDTAALGSEVQRGVSSCNLLTTPVSGDELLEPVSKQFSLLSSDKISTEYLDSCASFLTIFGVDVPLRV